MNVRDLQPIYIANYLGKVDGSNSYTEPFIVNAQVGDPKSYISEQDIAPLTDYDRVIYIPIGDTTEYINKNSILWIDTVPNKSKSNSDYTITKIGDRKNGILPLYCQSVANNKTSLYYSNDGNTIYEIKVVYDRITHTAISPLDMLILIDNSSAVWFIKPTDNSSVNGKIRLVERIREDKAYKWIFEDASK